MSHKQELPEGFRDPTVLPNTEAEHDRWQEGNRAWWESHPMRYDWRDPIPYPEFSAEFYREIDRRFFTEARKYLPWANRPFDALIDFAALPEQDVLEIGVGNGSHAQLLAAHAKSYTGIDLTGYAVQSTARRMECFGLKARILQMDAEQMDFPDQSFDFIWSWGVIHHSADTARILAGMRRVLRPGGLAITMVYHRCFWNYYVMTGLFHGVLRGRLFRGETLHGLMQKHTDGALARHYTLPEWRELTSRWFESENSVIGSKPELFPLPAGRCKKWLMDLTPDGISRLFLNRLGWGTFLISKLKPEPAVSA